MHGRMLNKSEQGHAQRGDLGKDHPGPKATQPGQGEVLLSAVLANESYLFPVSLFWSRFCVRGNESPPTPSSTLVFERRRDSAGEGKGFEHVSL